jgi:3-oxoacyl-[acyl-carrier protein] reductase
MACVSELKRSGAGAIVNIGGVSGHTAARHRAHVITAKARLIGLTKALAHDVAGDKVTVNCVVPGLIDTRRDPAAGLPSHHSVNRTLLGRLGAPDDIAPPSVAFLAGPSERYITGQTLHVNGGAIWGRAVQLGHCARSTNRSTPWLRPASRVPS